jgi:hypothetical protein
MKKILFTNLLLIASHLPSSSFGSDCPQVGLIKGLLTEQVVKSLKTHPKPIDRTILIGSISIGISGKLIEIAGGTLAKSALQTASANSSLLLTAKVFGALDNAAILTLQKSSADALAAASAGSSLAACGRTIARTTILITIAELFMSPSNPEHVRCINKPERLVELAITQPDNLCATWLAYPELMGSAFEKLKTLVQDSRVSYSRLKEKTMQE